MDVDWRRVAYASGWGAAAFLAGSALVAATVVALGVPAIDGASSLRVVAWLSLGANSITVASGLLPGVAGPGETTNLLAAYPRFAALRVLPPVLVAAAAIIASRRLGTGPGLLASLGTAVSVVPGYLLAAVALLRVSGARPALAGYVELFVGVGVVFVVGGAVIRPFFESAPVLLVAVVWSGAVAGIMALLLTGLVIVEATGWSILASVGAALVTGLGRFVWRRWAGTPSRSPDRGEPRSSADQE